MTRSFRFLLALRATVSVALGSIALALITLLTLRAVLDRELNSSILSVATIQAASVADGASGAMHFHEWDLTPDEAASVRDLIRYAQVWQVDGTSLLRSQYMTSDLPWDAEALARAADGELVWGEQHFEGSEVRTLLYPLERLGAAHEAHVLQIAAPLDARDQMLLRAGVFLGLLTLLLSGVTFAGSWWLAASAVRPVHQIIDQAEEIEAGSLERGIRAYAETTEYRRLVDVLNKMLGRIGRAFAAQKRFIADASHELRSPLTAMRGEIELALRRARAPDEYVRTLESTHEEVVRLSEITENLLMLARSDAGALEPRLERTAVGEVIESVVARLEPRARQQGIEIEVDTERAVCALADPRLIGQAVWNLLDNALRHVGPSGWVRVSSAGGAGWVTVRVEDDGPGLGDVDPERYFERFFRAEEARSRGSTIEGTGLGLAIVKAVVEAHGGSVSAESRPEGGARFSLRVPTTPRSDGATA